ncbi:N-acetylglucosamine-1-phosphodiester alpha-N-acetylglucosaminidase isoform X2 [Narcine bancroftii]|uniref:N-acetylglucosamine-1-phosphodiester alpha-N-acetylglucosaminidase isoform X2 n=1 Tax=Narcine bancroftii TaxID=1343680 RepID=UPI0038313F4E
MAAAAALCPLLPAKGCWCARLALGMLSLFCTGGGVSRGSYLNDLLPYYPLEHGSWHTHRYIRDRQSLMFGNVTHETWPADKSTELPVAKTTVFVSKFSTDDGNHKTVTGHFTFVNNPLRTVSVLEPLKPGGCSHSYRATVQETAKSRKCLMAQNGGFFNTNTGHCLGNIVSDGKLVRDGKGIQNAQFGIKKDGTLVFGYLSEEEVLDKENPFVQLVSGVVWLLRNGTIYINESQSAECSKTQETGSFERFVNVVSARNAVGHDKYGRLILFHVDGQTDDRGLNLWDVARFLKSQGVINAINLDGGGSATLVLNGSLASYPSDHCLANPMWRCPRPVSTILCVHEPEHVPENYSGRGDCLLGDCYCKGFWSGVACNLLNFGPLNCTAHGIFSEDGCLCDAEWMGTNCTNVSRCVMSQMSKIWKKQHGCEEDSHLFKEKTWLIVSLVLLILLLLSTVGNLFQFYQRCFCPGFHSDYSYQRLKDSNGQLPCVDIPEIIPLKQSDASFEEDNRDSETMDF